MRSDRLLARTLRGPCAVRVVVTGMFSVWPSRLHVLTEIDEGTDLAFGLCDLEMGAPELSYVSLTELRSVRGKFGLPVERDLHLEADYGASRRRTPVGRPRALANG